MVLFDSMQVLLTPRAARKPELLMAVGEWGLFGFVAGYALAYVFVSTPGQWPWFIAALSAIETIGMVGLMRWAMVKKNPNLVLLLPVLLMLGLGACLWAMGSAT